MPLTPPTLDNTALPLANAVNALSAVTDGLTAKAGGGAAGATLVTNTFNRFTTVATAADSGLLPPAIAGAWTVITNRGAAALQLFASQTNQDTINGVAYGTGISLAVGKSILLYAVKTSATGVPGQWESVLSA